MRSLAIPVLAVALGLSACGDSEGPNDVSSSPVDAGRVDLGPPDKGLVDLGTPDLGEADAGLVEDAGLVDLGEPDSGLPPDAGGPAPVGQMTGPCGELDDELTSTSPASFASTITFTSFDPTAELDRLSEGARRVIDAGTAGGSSVFSEALSYDILERCEQARLLFTEREVEYEPDGSKKTDLVVEISGVRIGVSVTRAVSFPRDQPFPESRARSLLTDKLGDIVESSANVEDPFAWRKQILHVLADTAGHAEALRAAESAVPAATRGDTILLITVTEGADDFIF